MSHFRIASDKNGEPYMEIDEVGSDILYHHLLNKGTAFTEEERREFELAGLLPAHVATLEEQSIRVYENYLSKPTNIEKYIHLRSLQDRNETLFYALVAAHLEEMAPIIYTPTVGEACQKGSHIFRHARGLYITPDNVEDMGRMARNIPFPAEKIEIIVVTDNQGILGIGDQGAGGMNIPIGKLSLYTLGAGIPPWVCLPISLDVGTNNKALLNDPLYLGVRKPRLTGAEYDEFIGKFVDGVKTNFPKALLQWEDFSKSNAFTNLDSYRGSLLSFNDDIQGTGAVVLAGITGAMKISDADITDQKFLVYGAGAGGMGVARQIRNELIGKGLSRHEACNRIYVVDSRGLVTQDRADPESYKMEFAKHGGMVVEWNVANPEKITLEEVVANARITVLLGFSGQPGTFTKPVVEAMAVNTPMPVIFPLSNPTSQTEALPKNIYEWSHGRAIVATGSPFPPVTFEGQTYRVGQGNNAFIFPGVGLGAIACGAKSITDEMFTAASHRLSEFMPPDAAQTHCVFPRVVDLPKVSVEVAEAVFDTAVSQGVAPAPPPGKTPREIIKGRIWKPVYLPYKRKK
ncbi:MAG: NAD-dependent malic enzyme [Nitrospinae bacterium]|nr:NAD-dependent malic enzyme [Nitrospinota bacterium]